jgi:hypothetical protein
VIPKAKGKTVVASVAAAEDSLTPIKKNENADVEGRPPRIPPITLPFFSAIMVIEVIQRLPTAKAKTRCSRKEVEIIF